jgi:hypothetical protein
MNATEYFAIFLILRLVFPVVLLFSLGEWARSREPRRFGRM